ncbi:hypothetical protein TREES_T100001033 [Tupaia chinensis]|uniref:Uncharacterized protein n=1 Tax=Tupaia chinensis TaxID=246437 RepID=L9JGK6_TUPCH|nr:hypothetical protein TREES_T100001033 [Tupaia chinensis]
MRNKTQYQAFPTLHKANPTRVTGIQHKYRIADSLCEKSCPPRTQGLTSTSSEELAHQVKAGRPAEQECCSCLQKRSTLSKHTLCVPQVPSTMASSQRKLSTIDNQETSQSPGQSAALSYTPRDGYLGPTPLHDATTCARSASAFVRRFTGAAFVRRFTAERAPWARPDPAPGPGGKAARRARQDQAKPRARGPAVTWRRSDNFDSPPPYRGLEPKPVSHGDPTLEPQISLLLPPPRRNLISPPP